MTEKVVATDRLRTLLAMVPWIARHPDGVAVDEVCLRFDISRARLVKDLEIVMMVGVHPFTPDTLIDAWIEDERVLIRYADSFTRPLRLTPDEAVTLIAAGRGVLSTPGFDTDTVLASAIDKIVDVVGPGLSDQIDVTLGVATDDVFHTLEQGRDRGRRVEIDYASANGKVSTRVVEIAQIFSHAGHWYASGWCHLSDGPRIFRIDRMRAARLTDLPVAHEGMDAPSDISFGAELPQVILEVDPGALWHFEGVPLLGRVDGERSVSLTIAVGSAEWLVRLLVQLGPAARVVEDSDSLGLESRVRTMAKALLENYR